MAIAPTGAIYKSLIFDGEDSRDYGVYITGQAVFNAPEREVEMISIPARNGLFALDQGRFENIEVTYPAGIFADSDADFAQAISDFRNFLCSRKGYCRLTDDYNPDEYRMAIYKSGLDVKLSELKAGEFNITFNCKPQRFLTSGEEAVTMPGKNLIPYPYYRSSGYSSNGATTTYDTSGVLTVNKVVGTSPAYFDLYYGSADILERETEYTLSFELENATDTSIFIIVGSTTVAAMTHKTTGYHEKAFTIPSSATGSLQIRLNWGTTVTETNAVIKPMIRLASESDTSYVRYNSIYNPTLFESSPMIEVKGKGSLNINDKTMLFQNDTLGVMEIVSAKKWNWLTTAHLIVRASEKALYNTGDTLTLLDTVYGFSLHSTAHDSANRIANAVVTDNNNRFTTSFITTDAAGYAYFRTTINSLTFVAGTDSTITDTITITATMEDGSSKAFSVVLNVIYEAEGTYGQSYFDLELNSTLPSTYYERQESGGCAGITANSTISILNLTRYVDCEIGEVYLFYNGTMFSLNKYTDLGSDLPVLKPGNNSITYSNTFTEVKIIPKWWKL